MKHYILIALIALVSAGASQATAACYADYKAKKDNPLRLHYGVIQLSGAACTKPALARKTIVRRLAAGGWQLLNVMSVFGADGLAQRRASAGKYFLHF